MLSRFAIAATAVAMASGAIGVAQAQGTLRVGIWENGPFGGTPPGGFCYDLMEAVAARTGLIFDYVPMPVGELITQVGAGETDLECSALAPTSERRAAGVVFAGPILTNETVVIVRSGDHTPYVTLADFAGKRLGVTNNAARQSLLTEAGLAFTEMTNPGLAAALVAGDIDAWIANGAEALGFVAETAGITIAETFRPINPSYGAIGVGIGDHMLLGMIQHAVEELKMDGTLAAIAGDWNIPLPPF